MAESRTAPAAADAPEEEAEAPRFIYVKAAPTMGNRMALWDRDPLHPTPDGEIKVYGQDQEPVQVAADSVGVTSAIDQKRIVVLDGKALDRARRSAEAARESTNAARDREMALRRSASTGSVSDMQQQVSALTRMVADSSAGDVSAALAELRAGLASAEERAAAAETRAAAAEQAATRATEAATARDAASGTSAPPPPAETPTRAK